VASGSVDVPADTRRAVRDKLFELNLLDRCADDIRRLLLPPSVGDEPDGHAFSEDVVNLWDESGVEMPSGINYADEYEVDF